MKILLVIDQYDNSSNGTTVSARRYAQALKNEGNTVTILGAGQKEEGKIVLNKRWMPKFVNYFLNGNDMIFAKPDKKIIRKAFQGQDIIHFYMPFKLSRVGVKIAEEMQIPHTAAFHVQPENISYAIGLGKSKLINNFLYALFRKFYNKFDHIHCPTQFIATRLKEHGYKAKMHVISNGVANEFHFMRIEKPEKMKNKIIITMVGRYAKEKRQDVLIEAVAKSKYSNYIQLVLAGKGLKNKKYVGLAKKCNIKPIMKFYTKSELKELLSYTDLYVHSADAEIEAISCLEAIAMGNVPIISDSEESATKQFALDQRSLFLHGDSQDLANKIDYWIEHQTELKEMRTEYSNLADKYRIENTVKEIEKMFEEEIDEYNK